jgi:23S rRNA (adenine2503-C2)-methyltransferase
MRIEQIRQKLRDLGAKPCHEARVLRAWLQARALDSGARRHRPEDFLPQQVRNALPEISAELTALARLQATHQGQDGSARLLVELADGQTVERAFAA